MVKEIADSCQPKIRQIARPETTVSFENYEHRMLKITSYYIDCSTQLVDSLNYYRY